MGDRRIVGIDPGKHGAFALYVPAGAGLNGTVEAVLDMPVTGGEAADHVDDQVIWRWLDAQRPTHVFLERVWAMPPRKFNPETGKIEARGDLGVTSAFNFGDAYATVRTAVRLCGYPMQLVIPQTWKKFYALRGGDGKDERARQLALALVPAAAPFLQRKKDSGRAEAILIARYGNMLVRADVQAAGGG